MTLIRFNHPLDGSTGTKTSSVKLSFKLGRSIKVKVIVQSTSCWEGKIVFQTNSKK